MLMKLIAARIRCALCLVTLFASAWSAVRADEQPDKPDPPGAVVDARLTRGAEIYRKQCAECHGDKGQGVEGFYDKRLGGERTLDWLTRRIDRTMPEFEADKCVGEDAQAVARYLYDRHYSPQARAKRLGPARRGLQHLTVEQHRQTLADLVGSFRAEQAYGEDRGLTVSYYKGGKMRGKPLHRAVEPDADAVFDAEHPLFEKFDPKGHSVRYAGSLIAPETGEYEIVLRSDGAVRLWLNNAKSTGGGGGNEFAQVDPATIDGWVKSEGVEQFRKRVFLLGGRAYPLLLDFSAHEQGVQRRAQDQADKTSYVSLRWVMPGRAEQVIPRRNLLPNRGAEGFVSTTAFPPDDASVGYERGVSVSPGWLRGVTGAAVETADHVTDHFHALAGKPLDHANADRAAKAFLYDFVGRAFRRPLTDNEKSAYVDAYFASGNDPVTSIRRAILAALSSPRFLYPGAHGEPSNDHAIAARIALALYDGLPDRQLREAADRGNLSDPATVRAHTRRLSHSPRAEAKLHGFFHHWLELDHANGIHKDDAQFPEFDKALLTDLRTSLDLFIEHAAFSEHSDYRELLLADYLFVNDRLAAVYGIERGEATGGSSDDTFIKATVPGDRRSGVITHPYLLTAFAYHNATSPIHRGVFLTKNIIGRPLNPPPDAIEFTDAEFDPSLTMREKVTAFTRADACMACHATINPLGFSLEHYDSIGRWRTRDNGKPVNAASDFIGDRGQTIRLKGARDVAQFAAGSDLARRGFIRQLFHHAIKRNPAALGPDTLDTLDQRFTQDRYHVRRLFAEIAATDALYHLNTGPDAPSRANTNEQDTP